MNTSHDILTASNIYKSFKGVKAVNGISLQLKPGECLALLGPNGAGKTTTCEIMEGLIEPDGGEITINGFDYKKNRRKIQEMIGVQLQETNLYKRYTVLETIQLFASFYDNPQDPLSVVKELGLEEKKDEKIMNLSGGQKQRVYLGCAIINNPKLLFLDEPTTGLDPQSRRMVWDTVETIKAGNRAIILTTHYMEEAERLADRIAIIDKGQIIAEGTPKELIDKYSGTGMIKVSFSLEKYSQEEIKSKISEKLPWFKDAAIQGESFEIVTDKSAEHIQEITRASDATQLKITFITMRQGTLEDVFLHFTGRSINIDK